MTPSGSGATWYHPVHPTRLIDPRPARQVGPFPSLWTKGLVRDVQVTGQAGIPADAKAVVLNVAATDVTQSTFITVYPKGTAAPNASNLNLAAGNTIANQVVVKLGVTDKIWVYNEAGSANIIVDVVGYYASGSGDAFHPLDPARVIDSRPA